MRASRELKRSVDKLGHVPVELGGHPFHAELIEDEAERRRLWALADRVFPAFATYRCSAGRAGRTIPIIQLEPSE